ncbi:extracellular calcium-sensing receptor-like [Actinia tenebrosa]|uniref:Extracellular calcium-sensing receptor-like n=1 Tax=Actinia tenebrosa TaxID=6105 RepID=A0A6P8J0D1_ACTTE|nr:extracellular calcium-sensing receptor-like [Actinia tenebrosa]
MSASDGTVSGIHLLRQFSIFLAFLVFSLKIQESNLQNGQYGKGDFIIGGLFPIHLQQQNGNCSELRPGSLVWSEAMKLAIEEINNNSSFLPNITLGYDIQDTCSHEQAAIASAAQFSYTNTLMFDERYKSAVNGCFIGSTVVSKTRSPVIAILGGEDSRVSVHIANVLQLTDTAQISYAATSSELSDRERFSTFFRTVPSDEFQSKAMVDIVNHYKWTCVALVGTDDVYGRSGLDSFVDAAKEKKICLAAIELFPVHDSAVQIKEMVKKLKSMKYVEIIVLYSLSAQAVKVFQECLAQNMTEKTWIASDGWSDSAYIRQKQFIPIIQGTIGIEFREIKYDALENHLRNFAILKSQENLWLDEFFILEFNCSRKGDPTKNIPICSGNQSISKDLYLEKLHNPISPYVRDAVYAVAHALNSFMRCSHLDCENTRDSFTPKKLVSALWSTSFLGLTGKFNFSQLQKQARYDIINLQVNNGNFEVVKIGEWDADELRIAKDKDIQWHNHQKPHSSCGSICKKGTYKSPTIQCIWECMPCSGDTFSDAVNSDRCKDCPKGFIHANNHTTCIEVLPQYIKWSDPWGIGLIIANCLCIILILLILGLVIKNYKTPIITETGGVLNVVLLIVILQTFVFNFVLLSKPSDTRCHFLTVSFYLVYTSGIVTFLLKLIFIQRFLREKKELNVTASAQNNIPTFTENSRRPMWHYYILGVFAVLFPTFMSVLWIVFGEMHSGKTVISRDIVYLACKSDNSVKGIILRFFSVIFLSVLAFLTTVYAYKTKRISQLQKFREAKHLAYAMSVFTVTLLIFYPGWTFIQGPVLQVFSCSMNMIAGSGVILCSFGPKIHVLLVCPVLNSFLHVHPALKSVHAAALGAGLTLLTTGKGRSATILEDSSPSHTISSPTTTTSIS